MDFITRFDRSLEEDYYALLGCHESSTVCTINIITVESSDHPFNKSNMCFLSQLISQVDQILVEYKHKALLYHPDKNPDDKTLVHKFQKLQVSQAIFTAS